MQAIESALSISRLDGEVAPLHVATLTQHAPEGFGQAHHSRRRGRTEESDSGDEPRLMGLDGEKHKRETHDKNDREPDPPHGTSVGMAGEKSSRPELLAVCSQELAAWIEPALFDDLVRSQEQ